VLDRAMLVELVKVALNHRVYPIRTAVAPPEVEGTGLTG